MEEYLLERATLHTHSVRWNIGTTKINSMSREARVYIHKEQKPPPILWLAHGLDRNTAALIEKVPIDKLKYITRDEYREE